MTDRLLPPVGALRPFEAAARLGSLSAAARALGVTQPAISRRIDGLEAWLGVALFDRSPRGLRLTSAGAVMRDAVAGAFERLEEAVVQLRPQDADRTVTIAAHPGFAQLWLAPRLAALQAALPTGYFRLVATDREDEFDTGGFDLAIRFGAGDWPGWRARKLLPERIVPVCSPSYRVQHPALAEFPVSPKALAKDQLLHMDEISTRWLTWSGWFAAQGITTKLDRPRLVHASYPLLLEAALRGEGVALGWLGLVDAALASGALVALCHPLERPDRGYFLCWREGRTISAAKRRLLERVRTWLVAAVSPVRS
ncbi:MAG TPA: LysR substrate-binding domain-containing protein [Stellaceae bacterium]|nr:LysR substrate-binding domain-containing protein [Stellaceae bacterium]